MHHWRCRSRGPPVGPLGLSGQLQMERTSGAGICGLRRRGARPPERFGGCTSKDVVEQRQKRSARRRRLQRDEGAHHHVVPRSNGEKHPRLPENKETLFFMGPKRGGIRLYRHRTSRNSLKRGFSIFGDARLQSFCGLQHKYCRAHVMADGCVKNRMLGTKEKTAISASYRLQSTLSHA